VASPASASVRLVSVGVLPRACHFSEGQLKEVSIL
jgi:hypothetical protein